MSFTLIDEISAARPELEALAAQIHAKGGSPWDDPHALRKFYNEMSEFLEIVGEDAEEALTEIADIVWYAAKMPATQLNEILYQIEIALEAAGLTPRQAMACCLAKYRYRAARPRGKDKEHRRKERELCLQSVKP